MRLDNDRRLGAFGLTTDKKDKATAREKPVAVKWGARTAESHVANALRDAYEEAINEDVPDEFLDLLGKLT